MQDGGIPATREEAIEDGKLNQYAHLYDVAREKEEREEADETLFDSLNIIAPKHVFTEPVYKGSRDNGVVIGSHSSGTDLTVAISGRADYEQSIAIGGNAQGSEKTTAVGYKSSALTYLSAAYGANSAVLKSDGNSVFSIGNEEFNRRIIHVDEPKNDQDAATKHYVDTQIANLPTSDVTKAYVDKQDQATILSASQLADAAESAAVASAAAMFSTTATDKRLGTVKASASISAADDGTITVNPGIFSDGLSTEDGQVSVDLGYIGEHLAGDALYYDSTDGLMLKVGDGLEIQNDSVCLDVDTLPLATTDTRGTVIVGSGLTIVDGYICVNDGGGLHVNGQNQLIVYTGPGLATAYGQLVPNVDGKTVFINNDEQFSAVPQIATYDFTQEDPGTGISSATLRLTKLGAASDDRVDIQPTVTDTLADLMPSLVPSFVTVIATTSAAFTAGTTIKFTVSNLNTADGTRFYGITGFMKVLTAKAKTAGDWKTGGNFVTFSAYDVYGGSGEDFICSLTVPTGTTIPAGSTIYMTLC